MDQKSIFLFGAGATLDWESPKTSELTQLIRLSGFKISDNKTTITEFIYSKLIENGYSEEEINFETILNAIEELIVYYSPFNRKNKPPSLLATFFSPKFENKLLNYSIKGGEIKHGYKLQIPKGVDCNFSKCAYQDEHPSQFFFQHLLSGLLSTISTRISKFAYHTPTHSVIDVNNTISHSFIKWIKSLSNSQILRFYTLNYERIFKVLLDKAHIETFEGFEGTETIQPGQMLRANIPRIQNDTTVNVHYNLHGSAYWRVLAYDRNQLENPEIVFVGAPHLQMNDDSALIQIEKGKTLVLSGIITGYQKAQKILLSPFRQMYASFDRDCILADTIYICGYSFGDEHINQSLKVALRYNKKMKIVIIDPYFIQNNMDYEFALRIFPHCDYESIKWEKVDDNLYSYLNGLFLVYTLGFKDFLKLKV